MSTIVIGPLKETAQKAFALAINQFRTGLFPDADKVVFTVSTGECQYITNDGLSTFKGTYYPGSGVCIAVVEDHDTTEYSYSWYFTFDVLGEYERMKDKEILEWTSDENIRHMHQLEEISYITDLLMGCSAEVFLGDTTKEAVSRMTPFRMIEFLERLNSSTDHPGVEPGIMCLISQFLEGVDDKNGFRTADDR